MNHTIIENRAEFSSAGKSFIDQNEYLLQFIYDFEENKNNFSCLLNSFYTTKPISFVGAGTSIPLGIPKWSSLMKDLCSLSTDPDRYNDELENSEKYQEIADKIYKELEADDRGEEYNHLIRSKMKPDNNTTSLTLIKLILAIDNHITTNFDNSLESAYNFFDYLSKVFENDDLAKNVAKHYVPELDVGSKNPRNIYYLHGNISKDIYILRKSDYELFYPSVSNHEEGVSDLEDCLKYFYKHRTILFIGFSFADFYIKEFFFQLAKKMNQSIKAANHLYAQSKEKCNLEKSNHFLLISNSDEELKKYIGKYHLKESFLKKIDKNEIPLDIIKLLVRNLEEFLSPLSEREFLYKLKNVIGGIDYNKYHKSLLKQSNMTRYFFEEFQNYNIYPVIYTEHIFLEHLFERLSREKISEI